MAAAARYIGGHIAHPELEIGAAYESKTMPGKSVHATLGMKSTTLSLSKALAGNQPPADMRPISTAICRSRSCRCQRCLQL